MTETRRYDSTRRREAAEGTRTAVLTAAVEVFGRRGWSGTSMKDVAKEAGVSVETIYASVGNKTALLKVALDFAVVGDDVDAPLAERAEFRALAEGDLAARTHATGRLLVGINRRTAKLFRALTQAAGADAELATLHAVAVASQRESNRQGLTAVSRRTPSDAEVDACTALLGTEVYLMLTDELGWSDEAYVAWVAQSLIRMFDLEEDD